MIGRSKVNTARMGLRRLAHVPLQKDFCFDVNGDKYPVSRYVAAFISRKVAKMLELDASLSTYRINVNDRNKMFQVILAIVEGLPIPREPVGDDLIVLQRLAKEIGNDEVNCWLTDYKYSKDEMAPETVVKRIVEKQADGLDIRDEVEYIAQNFAAVADAHGEKGNLLTELGIDVSAAVLSHEKLLLRDEDQLFGLIAASGAEFQPLLEFVEFQYVSPEVISKFIAEFDMNDLTSGIWMSLCRRLAFPIKPPSSSRFMYVPPAFKELLYTAGKPFAGIIAHIKEKCGRNPMLAGEVVVTCNTSPTNGSLENLFDYGWSSFVATANTKNSWYCIDMRKYKVGLTAYTLKSRQGDSNNDPIKWIVEGSDDNSTWKEIDNRTSDVLRRSNAVHTFELEKTEDIVAYKYIRFRQPGHNCGDNDYFNLANIELFGRLYEPKEE